MNSLTLKTLLACSATLVGSEPLCAIAQDGPPPEIRQAVDAVVSVLKRSDPESLEQFINNSLSQLKTDPIQLRSRLQQMRQRAQGKFDELTVEAESDGVRLDLQGNAGKLQIHVVINKQGIVDITEVAHANAADADPGANGRNNAIKRHVRALENAGALPIDELIRTFESEHLAPSMLSKTTAVERKRLFSSLRNATRDIGGARIAENNNQIELRLTTGPNEYLIQFEVESSKPYRIVSLEVTEAATNLPPIKLTVDNPGATFDALAKDGFSGVVSIRLGARTVLQQAYGRVNPATDKAMQLDSVFCIGSTPIDFTIAAIYLLEAQGKLSLDDSLGKFFQTVPEDKQSITISHLLSGQSGLPNFHHLDSDWDADLAWIDREEAERRILDQTLLFRPGQGRAHSHSAFVLLSAIIERVSKTSYFEFLQSHFLEPAGMNRTGLYGDARGISLSEFAVGGGPSYVGEPNIPPNWGKTSWLVMGSGGMYSTVQDLLKFYEFARQSDVERIAKRFAGKGVGVGGSDRGYYVFHVYRAMEDEALMLVNTDGRSPQMRAVSAALEKLILPSE